MDEGLNGPLDFTLTMRLSQIIISTISLIFMCIEFDFYSHTVFSKFIFVVTGILVPWSLTMALVDLWSMFTNRPPNGRKTVFMILVADMILAYMVLAAAASTASVADAMIKSGEFCSIKACLRYLPSAVMAFVCSFLLIASGLFNLWLLPSL